MSLLPAAIEKQLPDSAQALMNGSPLRAAVLAADGTPVATAVGLGVTAIGVKAMFSGNSADLLVNPASSVANHAMNAGTGLMTKAAGVAVAGAKGLGGLAAKGGKAAWHFLDPSDHHGAPTSGVPPMGGAGGRKLP